MIQVEEKEEIRKLYFRKRWSIRKIAREPHHSRRTVRRVLNDPYPPSVQKENSSSRKGSWASEAYYRYLSERE